MTRTATLVGRSAELGRIAQHLDALEAGDGGFLEIVGEPGIGKSTLLTELAGEAEARGFLPLRGRASQFELESPFDPFVDALDDYLATINPRRWEPLGQERVVELASAFPSFAESVESESPGLPSEERYRVHRSVRALLALIGTSKPLVLMLDDAHWSDQASLELLRHLVRRPPDGPVLVAIAYRTGTMPESWQALSDAAVREGDLVRIEVGPLDRDEADLLLSDQVEDAELRGRVFEAAGGNPFFMRQVAEAPQVVAALGAATRGGEGIPQAVVAAIGEEVAALDEPIREALQAAAIAGDPFDPGLAAAAAGIDERELLPRLDELGRRGLIRPGASPRQFQFRHPLVWEGVYANAPAGWRLAAHRRLATEMETRGASAATRAPHVEAAAQLGDLDAAALLREAAEASVSNAPASAAHWFESALRLLPETGTGAEQRVPLLVAAASALGSSGRLEESRDRLREAIDLIPPEAEEARVEAVVACANMENLLRNTPEAARMLTEALDSLSDRDSPQAAAILLTLTTIHVFDYGMEAARDWGREALDLAARGGFQAYEASAAGGLAYNEGRVGNLGEAGSLIDRAAALVDSLPRDAVTEYIGCLLWVAVSEMQTERFDDSVRHADRGRELARETDQGRWLPQLGSARCWSLSGLGRLDEAIVAAQEGLEMAELTGNRQFEALMNTGLSLTLTSVGRLQDAMASSRRSIELAGPVGSGDHISMFARQVAAVATLESGDPLRAKDLMLETADEEGFPQTELLWQPVGLNVLTRAELILGDIDAAARYSRRSMELAAGLGLGMRQSWAKQSGAGVELAKGNAERAAELAVEAAEDAGRASAAVERGRSVALLGRALARGGDEDGAIERLQEAYDLLDSCGADRYRDQAGRALRKLGVNVSTPARRGAAETGPEALSGREREVAGLVAEGRTNKEIAAALYISPKTVEKHLAHAFRKLGISKRAQVAAAIEVVAPQEPVAGSQQK